MQTKQTALKELRQIPEVGRIIANDLWNLGFKSVDDLKGHDPKIIYDLHNRLRGEIQDRCMLFSKVRDLFFRQITVKPKNNRLDKSKPIIVTNSHKA